MLHTMELSKLMFHAKEKDPQVSVLWVGENYISHEVRQSGIITLLCRHALKRIL